MQFVIFIQRNLDPKKRNLEHKYDFLARDLRNFIYWVNLEW